MAEISIEDLMKLSRKKVKQFHADNEEELEEMINNFLKDYDLIHINWYLNDKVKRATIVYK